MQRSVFSRLGAFCLIVVGGTWAAPLRDTTSLPSGWPASPAMALTEPSAVVPDSSGAPLSPRRPPEPSSIGKTLGWVAIAASGVVLSGAAVAYWTHYTASNRMIRDQGVNPIGVAIGASVAIPIGAVVTFFGTVGLLGSLGD